MRVRRFVIVLGILFLTGGGLFADQVRSDYDHKVDFSKYKTFMWIQEPDEPFMSQRIVRYVNAALEARGLCAVTEGADLAVGANIATEEKHTWETYYSGNGGWGWGWDGGGFATTTETVYEVATLTVQLFDTQNKALVWQGVATDKLSSKPEKQTRHYAKQVEKMFRDAPLGYAAAYAVPSTK